MEYVHRKDLIAAERLQQLMQKSDAKAWQQLLSHAGAIAISGTLIYLSYGTWWLIVPFIIHGILLNYLYAAQHELMHLTAFRSRRLNNFFSRITGFIVLFPRDYDRIMHFAHHRHTNLPGLDPELVGYNEQTDHNETSLASALWRLSAVPYWLRRFGRLPRVAVGRLSIEGYMSDAEQRLIIREARWHLVGYAVVLFASLWLQSWAALLYWLGPLFLTKWAHEVQNIVEHNNLPKIDNVLANTRTIHTHRLLHWLAWNMQYHCDHHSFAAVPFYHLPALHKELEARIENVAPSYRAALRDALFRSRQRPLPV